MLPTLTVVPEPASRTTDGDPAATYRERLAAGADCGAGAELLAARRLARECSPVWLPGDPRLTDHEDSSHVGDTG